VDIFGKIAEEKIREALENGEFNNLPGKGKPLNLDDLSSVPEDLRMGYKILKNAGIVPEELQLQKEILSLQDLIKLCENEEEQARLKKKLTEKRLRFDILMEKRGMTNTAGLKTYQDQINETFD
jgi:hypothetical protein